MKLRADIGSLDIVRQRMGAPLSTWTPRSMRSAQYERFEIETALDNVEPMAGGGPFVHEGQQVLLYIKDTRLDREILLNDQKNSRRFHIGECETLEQMRRRNRFKRYVVTNRTDGMFNVEATDPHTGEVEALEAELYVCKNCLKALDLGTESSNWPQFSIPGFFREYETFFASLPEHTHITAPQGGYPKNWGRIANGYKDQCHWTCEQCGVDLSGQQYKSLLQCHHRDGVISNNNADNLQALCVECHHKQPGHGRHPPDATERTTLVRLRSGQAQAS